MTLGWDQQQLTGFDYCKPESMRLSFVTLISCNYRNKDFYNRLPDLNGMSQMFTWEIVKLRKEFRFLLYSWAFCLPFNSHAAKTQHTLLIGALDPCLSHTQKWDLVGSDY